MIAMISIRPVSIYFLCLSVSINKKKKIETAINRRVVRGAVRENTFSKWRWFRAFSSFFYKIWCSCMPGFLVYQLIYKVNGLFTQLKGWQVPGQIASVKSLVNIYEDSWAANNFLSRLKCQPRTYRALCLEGNCPQDRDLWRN